MITLHRQTYMKEYMKTKKYKNKHAIAMKNYILLNKDKILVKRRERVAARINWLNSLKNRPCMDCKGWFEPCQMDWDHVSGIKKYQISQIRTSCIKNVLEEMKKCELVCANCHRLRTHKTGYPWFKGKSND